MRLERRGMSMSTAFGRDDAPTGADPEMMMRHHRIQLQRPTGDALAAVLARVAVEPKSPKRVDWHEFVRSVTT